MSDTGSKIFTVKLSPVNINGGVNVRWAFIPLFQIRNSYNVYPSALRNMITGPNTQANRLQAIEPMTILQLLIRAAPNLLDTSLFTCSSKSHIH